jgi:hypothetical protein
MHSFVRLLFAFGEKENGEKYGLQVAKELESIIEFTLKSKPPIAALTGEYFFSAIDAYIEMYNYAEPGKFNDHANAYLNKLRSSFESMLNAMRAEDAGKDRESRRYESTIKEFEMRWQSLFKGLM